MNRRRLGQLMAVAAAVLLVRLAAGHWPKDQTVRYVLGDQAPYVQELRARWEPGDAKTDDWTREVTFRYAQGEAPRIVTHEPRLPDGDYVVEIDIIGRSMSPQDHSVLRRRVELKGGVTSIDLSSGMSR